MEDPWGDPWSTDVPATTTTIDLPAASSAADGYSPRPVTDPWSTEADGWTGWDQSPDPDLRAGPSSPDPWAGVERKSFVEEKHDQGQLDDRVWEPDGADKEPTRRHGTDRDTGRQPSKVAELVDMYDGMARHSSRSSSTKTPVARDDVAVSGTDDAPTHLPELGEEKLTVEAAVRIRDDEDGSASKNGEECERENGFLEVETDLVESVSKSSGEDHLTEEVDDAASRALEDSRSRTSSGECGQNDVPLTEETDDATAKTTPTTSHDNESPAKVAYAIDVSGHLDSIFPSTSGSPSPERTTMSPVDDTFSTVSERKAWYRISRPGSMRRHNLGDEEGYTRVGWAKSRTRERTLKIVRRWMEEDSSGGGLNLLGRRLGSGRSTSFNWDSPASTTPVPIEELLRSRERGVERLGGPARAVAAFDWSGRVDVVAVASQPAEASMVGVPLKGPQALQPADQAFSLKAPHPSSTAVAPSRQTASSPSPAAAGDGNNEEEEEGEEEDEDDWGEMVSAPASTRKAAAWSGFGGDMEESPAREATSRLLLPGSPAAGSAASRPLMSGESPMSRGPTEDDDVVKRILGAIPDLSYMVR
ncbi:hypothetical protein L249_2047 [Ophiocordyceps polyrhachis-furcata BCC 54312]|uniref:Uncharacterized protein n=1 Tax=Ophiocordyceps polyrhachis-furcata BCC 54312 TaxID=1330021 RepID=A0A367LQZ7_9HYPO|nr:hypothetical protein L249_2047 [Ophiocordyceps polyrhachis-furcata BCC 54312]